MIATFLLLKLAGFLIVGGTTKEALPNISGRETTQTPTPASAGLMEIASKLLSNAIATLLRLFSYPTMVQYHLKRFF
jgi:hypothetical protein